MTQLTDEQIIELMEHFSREYHKEIDLILETRTTGDYDDLLFNTIVALRELLSYRYAIKHIESQKWYINTVMKGLRDDNL